MRRRREGAPVVRTRSRDVHPRLGRHSHMFFAPAERAATAPGLGRIPTVAAHHDAMDPAKQDCASVHRRMNFDQIEQDAQTAKDAVV